MKYIPIILAIIGALFVGAQDESTYNPYAPQDTSTPYVPKWGFVGYEPHVEEYEGKPKYETESMDPYLRRHKGLLRNVQKS